MNHDNATSKVNERGGWMPVSDNAARVFAENVARMLLASGYTVEQAARENYLDGEVGRDCARFSLSEGWLCVTNPHFPDHGDVMDWTFSFRELAAAVAKMEEVSPAKGLSATGGGRHEFGGWLPGCERTARVYAECMVRGLLGSGEYSTEQAEAAMGFGRSLGGKDGGYAILRGQLNITNHAPSTKGPEYWEFSFRDLAETVGKFESRAMREYKVSDDGNSESIRAASIPEAVGLYARAYKPERSAKASQWTILVCTPDGELLAEYEARQTARGRISTHEVATQPGAEHWAAQPGRLLCEVDVWGRTFSLEADFNDPQSRVKFNGVDTGATVEMYDAVLGGLGGGMTIAEAMLHGHLREVGNREFPTTVRFGDETGAEREITVNEMTGERVRELLHALTTGMRAAPAPSPDRAVGTPADPIYTGLNTDDGYEVMDAGAVVVVGKPRIPVTKVYRGRELETVEIVQIYNATRAAVDGGEPLGQAKLPVFELRAALSGTPIEKRVAVNLQDGTLYSLPVLESQGVNESYAEATATRRGHRR